MWRRRSVKFLQFHVVQADWRAQICRLSFTRQAEVYYTAYRQGKYARKKFFHPNHFLCSSEVSHQKYYQQADDNFARHVKGDCD